MSKLVSWSAVLAVAVLVLAVSTAAQAAVVDVTLTFNKYTSIVIGETLTWQVKIEVKNNQYDPLGIYPPDPHDLGVQSAAIGLASSNAGVVEIEEGKGPPPLYTPTGKPKAGTVLFNTAAEPVGFGNQSLTPTLLYTAERGLQQCLLTGTLLSGFDGYINDYTDVDPKMERGNVGHPVLFMSGTMKAMGNGTVTYTPSVNLVGGNYNLGIFMINAAEETTQRSLTSSETLNRIGATLTVGTVVTNTAPTVDIPGGDVHEEDWSKEPGWNNPLHTVVITAAGTDDGNPIPPGALSYVWTMSKPGGDSKLLAENGKVLTLTIAEIASLGLPGPYNTPPGPDLGVYMWDLSVKAYDGELYSPLDGIKVFVPEPATIGLLSFGIVGALLRRRRRA